MASLKLPMGHLPVGSKKVAVAFVAFIHSTHPPIDGLYHFIWVEFVLHYIWIAFSIKEPARFSENVASSYLSEKMSQNSK